MRIFLYGGSLIGLFVLLISVNVGIARRQTPQPIIWAMMIDSFDQVSNAETFSITHYNPDAGISRPMATLPIEQYNAFSGYLFLWTPDYEWLWYEDQRDPFYPQMQRLDYVGRHEQLLSNVFSGNTLYNLVWSPDGDWGIVPLGDTVTGEYFLHRIRPDGSELTHIADNYPLSVELHIFWSADSQHVLIVARTNQRRTDVYHINRADWRLQHVAAIEGGLIWVVQSPDQANVALVVIQPYISRHNVYSLATDGSKVILQLESIPLIHDLQWVDNQRFTAFSADYRNDRALTLVVNIERRTHIYLSFKDLSAMQYASWSPDGRYFVSYFRPVNAGDNRINLTMTTDRSQRWIIDDVQNCSRISNPIWSSSGQWFLYSAMRGGRCVLLRADYDGSAEFPLWAIDDNYFVVEHLMPPQRDWIVIDNRDYLDRPDRRLFDLETGNRFTLPKNRDIIGWTETPIEQQSYRHAALLSGILLTLSVAFVVWRGKR